MSIRHVSFTITLECHYRCSFCDMWKLEDPKDRLREEEYIGILHDLRSWNPPFHLNLSGGEPLRRFSVVESVLRAASQVSVDTSLNTNASLLTPARVERLLEARLNTIILSIDSPEPDLHNRHRGRDYAYESIIEAIGLLRRYQKTRSINVFSSTILNSWTITSLPELVGILTEHGIDGMLFQAIQPKFGGFVTEEQLLKSPQLPDTDALAHGLTSLKDLRDSGLPIFMTDEEFKWLPHYFQNPRKLPEPVCGSAYGNLVIGIDGSIQLCYNQHKLGVTNLGNIRTEDLAVVWTSNDSFRAKMEGCRYGCGMNQCNIRKDWEK